jgi:hypothetical protein
MSKLTLTKRNYKEYSIANVSSMSPQAFGELLSNELYSMVLVDVLSILMQHFKDKEEYLYCYHVQSWYDEHNII